MHAQVPWHRQHFGVGGKTGASTSYEITESEVINVNPNPNNGTRRAVAQRFGRVESCPNHINRACQAIGFDLLNYLLNQVWSRPGFANQALLGHLNRHALSPGANE